MTAIHGNTAGLSPKANQALARLYRRRVPLEQIATLELMRSLVDASRETKRQVGVLVHRSGSVESVIVGSATGLMLPDVGRLRAATGRFRALRLIHTHLFGEPLTQDDLTDLTRLRLDLVAAVLLNPEGEAKALTWAYNVPPKPGSDQASAPYEIGGPVPYGAKAPHFGQLIEALEAEFAGLMRTRQVVAKDGRAILVHVGEKRRGSPSAARASLQELASLAETAGVEVVDSVLQLRDRVDPKYVFGRGKLEEVVMRAIELDVQTLIFDRDLTPAQAAAIAQRTDLKVIDRSQLILDIFAQRAETRDGRLQVELAQLKYTLPRLGQKDDALSRLTGGIGGRGPGETKLEIGRRRARERVARLEKELAQLGRQRTERRRARASSETPVVAIVGYTNAGKSTLMNTITGASVLAEDKLFATLDTRARRLRLPSGREIVLTDTVGFIRDMPKDLFAAFRATFEEAADADLLLEVVDLSDPEHAAHVRTTQQLLEGLGLDELPRIRVYNKLDKLTISEDDPEPEASVLPEAAMWPEAAAQVSGQGDQGVCLDVAARPHRLPEALTEPGVLGISALDKSTTRALLTAIEARLDAALRARRLAEEARGAPEPWEAPRPIDAENVRAAHQSDGERVTTR
ncbi:MAG: GTPase HflX [Polyangiaceae bacterium]|nr:GTPase HflX [Polyangiaceae bacterium]